MLASTMANARPGLARAARRLYYVNVYADAFADLVSAPASISERYPSTAPITSATQVLVQLPFAPTTTLTAVAAPRKAPGMKASMGIFACSTMPIAANPTRTDRTGMPPPNLFAAVRARNAQRTPLRFEATVFIRPSVFPPAAKKQPQATIPAHTGNAPGPSAT